MIDRIEALLRPATPSSGMAASLGRGALET